MRVNESYNLPTVEEADAQEWYVVFGINGLSFWALTPCLLGIMHNLFILFILFEQQIDAQITIIKSLAFTDLCESISYAYLMLYPANDGIPKGFFGEVVCRLAFSQYLDFSLDITSAWHTVLFTVELYGNAHRDKNQWYYENFGSKSKIRTVIVYTWIFGFLIGLQKVFSYYEENGKCYAKSLSSTASNFSGIWEFIFIIVLPIMIISICYVIIIRKLMKAKRYYEERLDYDEIFQRKAVACKTKIVSISSRTTCLLLLYVLFWLPDRVFYLLYLISGDEQILSNGLNTFIPFLPQLNAVFDPFLYAWSWNEFRIVAKEKLKKYRRSEHSNTINDGVAQNVDN